MHQPPSLAGSSLLLLAGACSRRPLLSRPPNQAWPLQWPWEGGLPPASRPAASTDRGDPPSLAA
eukprot:9824967-Alexandrium_andersonii.AAC.1